MIRNFILFLVFVLSYTIEAQERSLRPEVRIHPYIEIPAGIGATLREIASVSSQSQEELRSLLSIEILKPMENESNMLLTSSEIKELIREKIQERKVVLFIPDQITVKVKKNILPNSSVINELNLALEKKCPGCVPSIRDLKIPQITERSNYRSCQYDFEQIRGGGSFILPVHCYFGDQSENKKTFWITGNAMLSKYGPITTRQIRSGEKISEADVRMEFVDVTYAKDGLAELKDLNGQIASRTLPAGHTLNKGDLKRELMVKRGQLLRAVSGTEAFEVSNQVIAEEQGYSGDLIKVKTVDQQRVLSGKVIEQGIVRVE